MVERLDGQVHIQGGPVQVVGTRALDFGDLPNGRVRKPRELEERREQLSGSTAVRRCADNPKFCATSHAKILRVTLACPGSTSRWSSRSR
jgi:hypothetical protein